MVKFWLGILCASWMSAQPVVKTVCAASCDYTDLQTAITASARGWIIVPTAGENFDTTTGFTLPSKPGTGYRAAAIKSGMTGGLLALEYRAIRKHPRARRIAIIANYVYAAILIGVAAKR